MAKKNNNNKLVISAERVWEAQKPRFNAFQSGHGAHKNRKAYDRKRDKKIDW